MEFRTEPRLELAKNVLPPPLYSALEFVFKQNAEGVALVGGTALAGFYAGHRQSDDLDLFTRDPNSQKGTTLAAQALKTEGALFSNEFHTAQYFRANVQFKGHRFTIDVVEDSNLFRIGRFVKLSNEVVVADLKTLLMTKAATLVSRCSEKDLYDLLWIFQHVPEIGWKELIELGVQVDAGVHAESLLLNLTGTLLRPEACSFSLDPKITSAEIYKQIVAFKEQMIKNLRAHIKSQPAPDLSLLVKRLKKWKKKN